MNLFSREQTVGIFRGFSEGGFSFTPTLCFPIRTISKARPLASSSRSYWKQKEGA